MILKQLWARQQDRISKQNHIGLFLVKNKTKQNTRQPRKILGTARGLSTNCTQELPALGLRAYRELGMVVPLISASEKQSSRPTRSTKVILVRPCVLGFPVL